MRIQNSFVVGLIITATLYQTQTHTTVIAIGNGTGGQTFSSKIAAKAFDRKNGKFFVGLNAASSTEYAISYFNRSNSTIIPQAHSFNVSIGTSQAFSRVALLSLVDEEGDPSPSLAVVPGTSSSFPDVTGKRVHLITNDRRFIPMTEDLVDVGDNTTAGIVALAASGEALFAAVRPNGSGSTFGQAQSGIALITFDMPNSLIEQLNTTTLDITTPELAIVAQPIFTTPTANQVAMHWDHRLQRLYVGLDLTTSDSTAGHGVRAVTTARIDDSTLTLIEIAPETAFQAGEDNIVGAVNNNAQTVRVGIKHLQIMHTSAGPQYLIVHGGVDAPGNRVFALPLVNRNNPDDVDQGKIAKKDAFDTTLRQFTTPATVNADLPTISDIFAMVGRGALPIESSNTLSDMVVVGDTVYVSCDIAPDSANETGIWYSQALFDQEGKIYGWTPWSKRAFPYQSFSAQDVSDQGRIAFFDIDAVTGKIWAVNGGTSSASLTRTMVATTFWGFGSDAGSTTPTSLAGNLNKALPEGCFCALDIDNATPDLLINDQATGRYALFGGKGKVVFTRVSSKEPGETTQTIIDDFSIADNLLISPLPDANSVVTTLGYSHQETTDANYFFAGTQQGLFVFVQSAGSGFSTTDLESLDQAPFTTGSWHKIDTIAGSVVDLKTSDTTKDGCLYVLTKQSHQDNGFTCLIYRIPYTTSFQTMAAQGNIYVLATSGTTVTNSDLHTVTLFSGIENVFNNTTMKEQLVLTTNAGIFTSQANETGANLGIISANNQTQAQWQQLITGLYTGIFGPKAYGKSTTWPIECTKTACQVLNNGIVRQCSGISSTDTITSFGFAPDNFTLEDTAVFDALSPITHFWSDGARRFFMVNHHPNTSSRTQPMVIPFHNLAWGIFAPYYAYALNDPVFRTVNHTYWTQHIGATGLLLMGTNRGVVSLE